MFPFLASAQNFLGGLSVNKALSDTRCSARYDTVRAVNKECSANMQAFEKLATDDSQPRKSRIEAEGYLKK